MGNCHLLVDEYDPSNGTLYTALSECLFAQERLIGIGAIGRVWKVTFLCKGETFALKIMRKTRIQSQNCVQFIQSERQFLSVLKHPFIVNMHYAFQTRQSLFLALDYMPGGDLRYHLSRLGQLTEQQTKFVTACILVGLDYLHARNVVHCDIKPENLVLDARGYIRITDFGAARVATETEGREHCGTVGYAAPEILFGKACGTVADFFSLGAVLYECMTGHFLFPVRNLTTIKETLLSSQLYAKLSEVPKGWSSAGVDFINKLLERDPKKRLGSASFKEVIQHPWLSHFNWQSVIEKTLPAAFTPSASDTNFDATQLRKQKRFDSLLTLSELEMSVNVQRFEGYFYDSRVKQHTGNEGTLSTACYSQSS